MFYIRSFNRFVLISLVLLGFSAPTANAATITYDYVATVTHVSGSAVSTVSAGDSMSGQISWDLSAVGVGTYPESYANAGGFSYSVGGVSGSFQSLLVSIFEDTLVVPNTVDQFKISAGSAPGIRSFGLADHSGDVFSNGELPFSLSLSDFTSSSIVIYNYGANDLYNLADGDDYNMFASVTALSVSPVPVPAAFWLFGSALIGLVGFGKRRKAA